jgi:alpha-mannosidase
VLFRSIRHAKFAFIASDIPAMGYAVYHVVPGKVGDAATPKPEEARDIIETTMYRARFDSHTGALTSLHMKPQNWETFSGPANVVAEEQDNGDFWELNHNLDGSQSDMMKVPVKAPERGRAQFSDEYHGEPGAIQHGAVFSEFRIKHQFGKNTFATSVRIYEGLPRMDFTTQILNEDQHVRYRVMFPTTVKDGRNFQEIPFGAIERPQNMEFPAQNWSDFSNSQTGLALLNRGLPGNNVADGALLLSLLRSVQIQAYNKGGGFEGQNSDSGFELGKEFTFQYALLPHPGDWKEAQVYRAGLEFNNPLIVQKTVSHAGTLPNKWGLAEDLPGNVVLSALKPAKDGTAVIRVYEADGRATKNATVRLNVAVLAAEEVNLL